MRKLLVLGHANVASAALVGSRMSLVGFFGFQLRSLPVSLCHADRPDTTCGFLRERKYSFFFFIKCIRLHWRGLPAMTFAESAPFFFVSSTPADTPDQFLGSPRYASRKGGFFSHHSFQQSTAPPLLEES